jgi:predicted nucleotidyltransferase
MSQGFRVRTDEEVMDIAQRFGSLLQTFLDRVEIRLFGSYQHQRPNAQSDLDFAVVSKDFQGIDPYISLKLLNRAKMGIDSIIEPVALTPKELASPDVGSIAFEIAANSRLVFKAPW